MARYIDAEVLKKALLHFEIGDAIYPDEIEMYIDDTPTADVVEVKHGKWKAPSEPIARFEGRYLICSECNVILPIPKPLLPTYYYCPNCGAEMDPRTPQKEVE